jgi:hypothetical protein
VRVKKSMRPYLNSALGEPTEFAPIHRRELVWVCSRLRGEFGNIKGPPFVRIRRASEHRAVDTEPFQYGDRGRHAAIRIVEGDVEEPALAGKDVRAGSWSVASAQQPVHLAGEHDWPDGEGMQPGVGDGVITEHERPEPGAHRHLCSNRPGALT